MSGMTIGELAARFGLEPHVLRHWESVGLLLPTERVNGRRRYRREQEARIALILGAKAAGLSLERIRQILQAPDRSTRRKLLLEHRAELDRRQRELDAARAMVDHALTCRAEDFTRCLDFRRIVRRIEEGEAVR